MRFLILSANTGGGHNAAAYAIQEELNSRGYEADVEDGLRFISDKASQLISWGHSYVYKHLPRVFGRVHDHEERHSTQWIRDILSLGASKYHAFISERDYCAVISVHAFTGALVSEAQMRYGKLMPHYFVSTDYTCSPLVPELLADAWFIPDATLADEYVHGGIAQERIIPTGIPIRHSFSKFKDKAEAKRSLGLPIDGRVLLVCSGSIGCGKMDRIVPEFAEKLPKDTTMVVICGNNEKLYEQLSAHKMENVRVVGYTDQIAAYMMAADVCISKPGGLSTTELLTAKVPSVMVLLVPGCETRNYDFVTSRNLALGAEDWETAIERALTLLEDEEKLREMQRNLLSYHAGDGAEKVVESALKLLKLNEQK